MAEAATTETMETMEILAVQMQMQMMQMLSMLGKFFYRLKVPGGGLFFCKHIKHIRADVLSVGDICMNCVLLSSAVLFPVLGICTPLPPFAR